MIAPGQRIRHRKQPAWGVGRVVTARTEGEHVELTIAFADSERRLRLKPDMLVAMIEVLTAEQIVEADHAVAEAKRLARTEARHRSKAKAAKKHTARLRRELQCMTVADDHGHALVASQGGDEEGLLWLGPDGGTAEHVEFPIPPPSGDRFMPDELLDGGHGLWIGTRVHQWGDVLFVRRGQRARIWRAPVQMGVARATPWPGVGALVYDLERVIIAREAGDATIVPIALEGRSISAAKSWGDGLLVGLHGPDKADEYFTFVYLSPDGSVRFRGIGSNPTPIDDDTMIAYDRRGVQAITRSGVASGRLDVVVDHPRDERQIAFARVEDELVFALAGETSGLVRWHPRVDAPRWTSALSTEYESLTSPVRVGRFIAITSNVYSEPEAPRVWLVDGETGVLEHAFEIKKPPTYLLPVGDDALVAVAFSKQPIAWRSLSTEPERLLLVHSRECSDAVSPAPGVVVTSDGNGLNYFDL